MQGLVGSVAEVGGPRAPCPDPGHHLCPGDTDMTSRQACPDLGAGRCDLRCLLSHKHYSRKETWC